MASRPGTGRPRGRGRGRRDDFEDGSPIEDTVVKLYRCATVVKGGRRFSFGALVVVGDRKGQVGYGYGKANEVPPAVEKGIKQAKRNLFKVPLRGTSIPHRIIGRFGSSRVVMVPASEGTGVIAGSAPRAVLELAGVKDVLTKCYGSTSPKNLVKATIQGLQSLRTRAMIEELRGVKLDLPPDPEPIKQAISEEDFADNAEAGAATGGGVAVAEPRTETDTEKSSKAAEQPEQTAPEAPAPSSEAESSPESSGENGEKSS